MGLFIYLRFNESGTNKHFYASWVTLSMDPFNIKITVPEQVSLTILPTDKGYYKIIYYAAILSAIEKTADGNWRLLSNGDIEAGDLPFYVSTQDPDRLNLELDEGFAKEVGAAIEKELTEQD